MYGPALLENERVYESASRRDPASCPKLTESPVSGIHSSHKSRVWEEYELGGELVQLVGHHFLGMSQTVCCGSHHYSRKTTKVL